MRREDEFDREYARLKAEWENKRAQEDQGKGNIMGQNKGFYQALFDFSFTTFITSRVINFLYGLSIVGVGLCSLLLIGSAFSVSVGLGVFMLIIGAPLVFLLGVIYVRVFLELIVVIFRIAEHLAEIRGQGQRGPSEEPFK